ANGSTATRVVFRHQEFELAVGREQLLDVLVSAFEDVVHLNQRYQDSEAALRDLNAQLQHANRDLADHNRQWQLLGDELAASALSERQAYQKLRASEARIRRLVDANIIGIILVDLEGNVLEANDAFLQMVGYTHDELLSGQVRWDQMTPAEYRQLDEQ